MRASTYSTYLTKLKRLQNKALRIISEMSIRDRITPQYHQFEILKLEDLYTYEIAKFMYQCNRNKLLDTFNHYFTSSSNVSHYTTRQSEQPTTMFLPRFMTTRTQRSIKFIGTKTWNNIQHDVKKLPHSKFKTCYKKILLNTYNQTPHSSHL